MTSLSDQEFIRYQRQIALPEMGEQGQVRLKASRVLVIGCGGLASVVVPYIVGAGIGSVVIIDDDDISLSNLHRQLVYRMSDIGRNKAAVMKEQLTAMNDQVRIRAIDYRLNEEQLNLEVMMADIVVDCSDNFTTRYLINQVCFRSKTMLVSGAAIDLKGQFAIFDYRKNTPCYCCVFPTTFERHTRCSESGVLGPVVGAIGSLQALEVIKALSKQRRTESSEKTSYLLTFDGMSMVFKKHAIHKDPECTICGDKEFQNVC